MLKLSIMMEHELNQIFGTLDSLIPLHEGEQMRSIIYLNCCNHHNFQEAAENINVDQIT